MSWRDVRPVAVGLAREFQTGLGVEIDEATKLQSFEDAFTAGGAQKHEI